MNFFLTGPINFETCTKSHVTEINQTYVELILIHKPCKIFGEVCERTW